MTKIEKTFIGILNLAFLIFMGLSSTSAVLAHDYKTPTPKDYGKYIVLMAKGNYVSVDGSIMLDGLIEGDGLNFQMNIIGRNEEEAEQNRQEAIAFFAERFGLDAVNDVQNLYFTGFQLDPQNEFRAYTVSGERVPAEGWQAYGGGWAVYVINPEGMTLGGEFEGTHVDVGTSVTFAEYYIERDEGREPILIHKRSLKPVRPPGVGGQVTVLDEFDNDEFGSGLNVAVGNFNIVDGLVDFNARVVLTTPK